MNKKIKPYKSRKDTVKRERIIMLVSSGFVLAALTMTGLYMRQQSLQEQNDGYSVDLSQMENNVEDKYAELTENVEPPVQVADNSGADREPLVNVPATIEGTEEAPLLDEELDYMPKIDSAVEQTDVAEANSGRIEIPGLTDVPVEAPAAEELPEITTQQLSFTEEEGLIKPVEGNVLMHYNMDNTVYFATLDQYKYNPAVIFQAEEGSNVVACADAKVKEMYQNEEIGHALVLELGNGYEVTYGQLAAIHVNVGDKVAANQVIATVAKPTKYYVTEGCNLYFALERYGETVNPEDLLP